MGANRIQSTLFSTQTVYQQRTKSSFAVLPSGMTANLEIYRQAREDAEAVLRPQPAARLNLFAVMN